MVGRGLSPPDFEVLSCCGGGHEARPTTSRLGPLGLSKWRTGLRAPPVSPRQAEHVDAGPMPDRDQLQLQLRGDLPALALKDGAAAVQRGKPAFAERLRLPPQPCFEVARPAGRRHDHRRESLDLLIGGHGQTGSGLARRRRSIPELAVEFPPDGWSAVVPRPPIGAWGSGFGVPAINPTCRAEARGLLRRRRRERQTPNSKLMAPGGAIRPHRRGRRDEECCHEPRGLHACRKTAYPQTHDRATPAPSQFWVGSAGFAAGADVGSGF